MIHRRFFVSPKDIVEEKIHIIDKDDIHHILRVLRLKEKDKIIVLDGLGNEYQVIITSIALDGIRGKIVEKITHPLKKRELILIQALPKMSKMDLIVSKCTELGVTKIIPVNTQRSIIHLKEADNKLNRWNRIAKSSSAQCQRVEIPIINPITNLVTALELIKEVNLGLILDEKAKKLLREVFLTTQLNLEKVAIIVGPEGGFTQQEIQIVEDKGIIPVSLGVNVLRCETAPIVASSIILYELGMLG